MINVNAEIISRLYDRIESKPVGLALVVLGGLYLFGRAASKPSDPIFRSRIEYNEGVASPEFKRFCRNIFKNMAEGHPAPLTKCTFEAFFQDTRYQGSIRYIDETSFLLDTNQTDNVLGKGASKVAKATITARLSEEEILDFKLSTFLKHAKDASNTTHIANRTLADIPDHRNLLIIRDREVYPIKKKREGVILPRGADLHPSSLKELGVTLSFEERLHLAIDLLRGLEHLHKYHRIHQDIKPENCLFFEEDGHFIAKLADLDDVTTEGSPRESGTPGFILKDAKTARPNVDLYAMGETLRELFKREVSPRDYAKIAPIIDRLHTLTADDHSLTARKVRRILEMIAL